MKCHGQLCFPLVDGATVPGLCSIVCGSPFSCEKGDLTLLCLCLDLYAFSSLVAGITSTEKFDFEGLDTIEIQETVLKGNYCGV